MVNSVQTKHIEKLEIHNRKIFFDSEINQIFEIDDLASEIWDLLQQNKNREDILSLLNYKYKETDLCSVLNDFEKIENMYVSSLTNHCKDSQFKKTKKEISVWLHISQDCNMRCRYCFAANGTYGKSPQLMSWITAKKAVDFFLRKAEGNGCSLRLIFFGGEPLLNIKIIIKIVDYCLKQDLTYPVHFSISTNGTLLDEKIIKYSEKYNINLLLSLDGPEEIHNRYRVLPNGEGSFRHIITNYFKYLAPSKIIKYQVSAVYTPDKLDLIKRVIFFRKCGFNFIKLEPVSLGPQSPYAFHKEDLPKLEEEFIRLACFYAEEIRSKYIFSLEPFSSQLKLLFLGVLKQRHCSAGRKGFSVSAAGDIFPCPRFATGTEHAVGSIESGLNVSEIEQWEASECFLQKEECSACWARNMCGGGCRADSAEFTGNILTPYAVNCEITKIIAKTSIWLYCELASGGIEN